MKGNMGIIAGAVLILIVLGLIVSGNIMVPGTLFGGDSGFEDCPVTSPNSCVVPTPTGKPFNSVSYFQINSGQNTAQLFDENIDLTQSTCQINYNVAFNNFGCTGSTSFSNSGNVGWLPSGPVPGTQGNLLCQNVVMPHDITLTCPDGIFTFDIGAPNIRSSLQVSGVSVSWNLVETSSGPVCGNGICEPPTEDLNTCSQDCGGPMQGFCGDGICQVDENEQNCAIDCAQPEPEPQGIVEQIVSFIQGIIQGIEDFLRSLFGG